MKTPSDIERLLKRRQLNVAEQNAVSEYKLLQAATWFRAHRDEIPSPIRAFLEVRSIDLATAIDFEYEDLSAVGLVDHYSGLIVTMDRRFWRWELQLYEAKSTVVSIEEWREVTNEQKLSAHTPGTGKSQGLMCLAILAQLNLSPIAESTNQSADL